MKKALKKLTLNRDTVRNLAAPTLQEVAAGNASLAQCSRACTPVSCHGTCDVFCTRAQSCNPTCTCPSFCPCPF